MGDYFRGWKRKLGVVTLLVACVFTAGWVRSCYVGDDFGIRTGRSRLEWFGSGKQHLLWGHVRDENPAIGKWYYKYPAANWETPGQDFKWRWNFGEFGVADGLTSDASLVVIPYWSIVLPLTLLSAWLFFSKPRVKIECPAESGG